MPKSVPVKNIDPVTVDIKRPGYNYRQQAYSHQLNLSRIPQDPLVLYQHSRPIGRIVISFAALLIVTFGVFSFLNFQEVRYSISNTGEVLISNFYSSLDAFKDFQPDQAAKYLRANDQKLTEFNDLFGKYYGPQLLGLLSKVVPATDEVADLLNQIHQLNQGLLELADVLQDLKINGLTYFQTDGSAFISKLNQARDLLTEVKKEVEIIRNTMASIKDFSSILTELDQVITSQYLNHISDFYLWDNFLGSFINMIDTKDEAHILLMFQNPAEIRPGGGFIGSYADITLKEGQIYHIDVRDIYDPDGQLDIKMIPPEPLQATTQDWEARDANWFFDFPTSAAKVIQFLELSKLYQEQGINFQIGIALNIRVLETIFDIIGPISLENYNLVIDQDNFLIEIQREVEAGADKRAGYPKRILRVLTPLILERLQELSGNEKNQLIESLAIHVENKDIMFFAKDQNIQNFFIKINSSGSVYSLPQDFWGTYLAVVNANIAGGKSDVFVNQEIDLWVDVDTNGNTFNNLTITRTHNGDKEEDYWWRQTNKNFIQILTTPNSQLISLKGNTIRKHYQGFDYQANGYQTDPDLKAIEETQTFLKDYSAWLTKVFGKTAFSTWFNVPAGQSKSLNLRYETPYVVKKAIAGETYRFILERQSGVNSSLKLKISAPIGYKWQEVGGPVFLYETDNIQGRTIIDLTLLE